jgi:diguanylate cyclase
MIRYFMQFETTADVVRRTTLLVLLIAIVAGVTVSLIGSHYFANDAQGFMHMAYAVGAFTGILVGGPIVLIFFLAAKEIYGDHKQVEKIAREDFLTGLLNRREFFSHITSPVADSSQPLHLSCEGMLLILDADNFKRINDNHGHLSGDKALIAIANAVGSAARGIDIVSRIGGEEFAVLVSDASHDIGAEIAAQILLAVNSIDLTIDSEVLALSVSIGAVRVSRGLSLSVAMKAADAALYRAKHGGKNMVVFGGVTDGLAKPAKSLPTPSDTPGIGSKVA